MFRMKVLFHTPLEQEPSPASQSPNSLLSQDGGREGVLSLAVGGGLRDPAKPLKKHTRKPETPTWPWPGTSLPAFLF